MASVGYGYTRAQVITKATEYGKSINKITKPLSRKWFYALLSRWPSLKVTKPSGLNIARAKSASPEVISKYFQDLESILTKYDLHNSPEKNLQQMRKAYQLNTPLHMLSLVKNLAPLRLLHPHD